MKRMLQYADDIPPSLSSQFCHAMLHFILVGILTRREKNKKIKITRNNINYVKYYTIRDGPICKVNQSLTFNIANHKKKKINLKKSYVKL